MKTKWYIVLITLVCYSVAYAQEQKQVNVSVKIIEFQTTKGKETGLSAYFKQRMVPHPYGIVSTGRGILSAASLAFPNRSTGGVSLFLDQLSTYYGDFEVVLQALIDQNRAFILSQPKVMVPVGGATPTIIKTTQDVSYENTVVVGATTAQTTAFRPTGVTLTVSALSAVDDDGNPATQGDIFIQLKLIAEINEEGGRITVALDDKVSSGSLLTKPSNAISVPEFISRSIDTTVWVRQDQVLILGGLYRSTKNKSVASLPWLTQGENILNNVIEKISPVDDTPDIPLASSLGNREDKEARRELVFLVKADMWRKAYTVSQGMELYDQEGESEGEIEGEGDIIHPSPSPGIFDNLIDSLTGNDSQGVGNSLGGRN
jgi:Flp pilus assembly secretin CpaC